MKNIKNDLIKALENPREIEESLKILLETQYTNPEQTEEVKEVIKNILRQISFGRDSGMDEAILLDHNATKWVKQLIITI